jgi:hypothetical protein
VAWHRIDYDGLWSSDKLNRCSDDAQADYVWVYGIADAHGCFELTNLHVVRGRVAAIRKGLSLERLERDFEEYRTNGLCFTWQEARKRYGYWVGCESRLPAPSTRSRYTRSTPPPPNEQLDEYVRSFGGTVPQPVEPQPKGEPAAQPRPVSQPREASLDVVATASRLDRDNGNGTGTGTEREPTHTPSRPTAEVNTPGPQPFELHSEGERFPEPQTENQPCEAKRTLSHAKGQESRPDPKLLVEIYEQERGSLPAVKVLSDERLSKCRARLLNHAKDQEKFLADFRAAVRHAGELRWPGWRPSFDWFVANDTNYAKVWEGNYDNWQQSSVATAKSRDFATTDTVLDDFRTGAGRMAPHLVTDALAKRPA